MWNYLYLAVCLLFTLLLLVVIVSKKRVESRENSLFSELVYVSIFSISSEIILQYLTLTYGFDNIFMVLFSKLYLISIITCFTIFSKYVFYMFRPDMNDKNYEAINEKFMKRYNVIDSLHNICFIISAALMMFLPIEYFKDGTMMYSYGSAVDFLRLNLLVFMTAWIVVSIKNHKKIFNVKYAPIFIIIILLLMNILLQQINPTLLIISFTFAFLCYIMFFTIENPDLKMLRQMEISKLQAERANRAKSDFLSSMSHEIRTPLNAIVGLSEDIASFADSVVPQVIEDTEDIRAASQTLLEIVGNILDISKIESDKMEIINEVYNPKENIETIAKINATRIGDKQIEFKINISEDLPYELYGDKTHLKQVLNNLLSNAFKYTNEGEVVLTVKCINRSGCCTLIISVEDTGRGIKPEDIDKLFTKFERIDANQNTTIEGTGLGLAITKKLVEMMGGKISVQSKYGKGSLFMVQIPQKINKMIGEPVDTSVAKQSNLEQKNSSYAGKKILIVDDNKLNIKVARRALKDFDFVLDEAYDGAECLRKVSKGNEYDLILMDIMMPNMSGEETLAKLKENPNFKIPTIALTADAIAGSEEKYISAGFISYIAKPFNKEQIEVKIKDVFNKNEETEVL